MKEIQEKQKELEELWRVIKQSSTESEIQSFCSLNANDRTENEYRLITSNSTTYGDYTRNYGRNNES